MKRFYLILCIAGVLLPLWQFIPWLAANGMDIPLLIRDAAGSRIAAFAWLDVIVSAVVLIGFVLAEGKHLGMPRLWLPVCATLCVGVSLGLPLFLYLRERHREEAA